MPSGEDCALFWAHIFGKCSFAPLLKHRTCVKVKQRLHQLTSRMAGDKLIREPVQLVP